ncbi:carbohydrate binding domain-containing protein, partial [Pseudomonas sp. Sample_9]|uniref:carbohydrate binding domain-containing protein n=1 Tax=Pseudomonas sp. Sample_9 TaxID=2382158 RepID=UPI0019D602DF
CKEDSQLSIRLEVAFFSEANVNDALSCEPKTYLISETFDDLTTFTNYDMNNWTTNYNGYLYKITKTDDQYYLQSIDNGAGSNYHGIFIKKIFFAMKPGEKYAWSLDFKTPTQIELKIYQNGNMLFSQLLPPTPEWSTLTGDFYVGTSIDPCTIIIAYAITLVPAYIDNLRIRKI